jgi:TolB-like protein/DNA-binding winged helix-turn-helix (wHTH) protein/predicted ATPase
MAAMDRKLFQFGRHTLDTLRGCLRVGDREIPLRPKSFELLRWLVENAGRLASKDELIEAVWRKTYVTDDSLARCISDVRQALDDERQEIVRTVRGRGYLFAATVSETSPDFQAVDVGHIAAGEDLSVSADRDRGRRGGASIAGVSAASVSATLGASEAAVPPRSSISLGEPPIAVSPFANLSGDPRRDDLAGGITRNIIAALSKLRTLSLVARHGAAEVGPASGERPDAECAARFALEGSVRRFGDRIRIFGQLIETDSGEHVWADHYDGRIDEPHLTLQGNVVSHLVASIESVVGAFEKARKDPPSNQKTGQAPYGSAERRQLTVMACELVRPATGSAIVDLEDLREALAAFQHCVADTVARFNGFRGHHVGNSVRVYFGYPTAREDDAEQAVRAGLELCEAMRALGAKLTSVLACRVGIATGPVIVGDLAALADAQERDIVGEAPNAAWQLQFSIPPDAVAIDAATKSLIGSLFDCESLGASGPQAWRVLGASALRSRFEALRSPDLGPLVGRDEEVEALLRRWRLATSAAGRVVLISGEPGIGKSRLTAALLQHIANEPHTRLRYFCSPQHEDSALYPIIGQLERVTGIARDDAPSQKLDKLDALLAQSGTPLQDAALLAEMLSLPSDGRYPALDLAPQLQRQKTLEALVSQVEGLARRKPVVIIFEDAHWTDPTSLEVLGRLIDKVHALRVMAIVTFRPEFEAPWVGRHYVTALSLNRLGQNEAAALIDGVIGAGRLSAAVRRDIVERTDGIPLFVEEMTKSVLEAEGEGAAGRLLSAAPSVASSVPPSLHASLMARLDRLGPAKSVAQAGAAIGGEFSHTLLAAVVRDSGSALGSALDRLIQAGLLFRQGAPPHATYLFKHALVQDAAYGALLREPRRALHARIVEALDSQLADLVESKPELLARHCAEAGLMERSALLWGKAGQRSLARSALKEAEAQLARALAQIAALPSAASLRRVQIAFQIGLANAIMQIKGYAAPETKAAFDQASALIERAEAMGESLEDPLASFSVLYGFWIANFVAFNGDSAHALAAQFMALARRQKANAPLMIAHRVMGNSSLLTGDLAEGRAQLDRAFALYDPAAHRSLAPRFGQDVMVAILSWRSLGLWVLGYPEAARADVDRALKEAREIDHAVTLIVALTITTMIRIQCGDYEVAKAQLEEAGALAGERGALLWTAIGSMFRGAFALTGDASNAVRSFIAALPAYRATGATVVLPFFLSGLARAHAELGQFDEAARRIGEAARAAQDSGERWCDAEIHRTAGEIALMAPERDAAAARAHFERALTVSRAQKAKSWELRAATSLARLLVQQGDKRQALSLLAPIYGWFKEGFDTPDLRIARALLDQLAT